MNETLNQFLREVIESAYPALPSSTAWWEVPKDPAFGDLSTPIAFRLASAQRQPPGQVAAHLVQALTARLQHTALKHLIERLEAKGGFVNLFLSQYALIGVLTQILTKRHRYGMSTQGRGQSVLIEFVSANPTGPLSVAHGRQAAVGDALARILRFQGHRVVREYYLNDEGRQIDLLGQSLRARYLQECGKQEPFPEDGYHGEYVTDSARAMVRRNRDGFVQKPLHWFIRQGMKEQLNEIKHDLIRFGLRFDRWTSQRWLRTSGRIDQTLKQLHKQPGVLYAQDGALWFASTKFGDDKDRVVRKQFGELTYLAPDIAYHRWKFQRRFTTFVNLWGPDHHGYIPRLKAAVLALGLPVDRLVIRIVQLVTLSRGGKLVPMSKRQGEFVSFRQVLEEVGVDATRFFYLMRTTDSHLDFDLELAQAKVQENPVYYVQYAHARICSLLAYARTELRGWRRLRRVDLTCLVEPEERLLLRHLFQFPMVVLACAQALEPHGLTSYLQKLAERFHIFYATHRVISEDLPRSLARLKLVTATRSVLVNGLGLLGVTAPQKM